ncbi:MAG: hypothetical protein M0C28_13990 [Candidatus Moduliflexus flocculans]|nr:hypothetical protein [Candidatus Moduliflexus flocculans]
MLRLRGRVPRLVLLLRQRGLAGRSAGDRPAQQPAADPPDALPFQGDPNGEFLGYAYMALPFTEPVAGEPPTGDQAWTCFLSAANFKGPIAYYIPETWSKIGKLFNYPFIYGRGPRRPAGDHGRRGHGDQHRPRFRVAGRPGRRLYQAAGPPVPGRRPRTDASSSRT